MRQEERSKGGDQPQDHPDKDRAYTKPKLTYVSPKLAKLGDIKEFTAGFFGSFSAS